MAKEKNLIIEKMRRGKERKAQRGKDLL